MPVAVFLRKNQTAEKKKYVDKKHVFAHTTAIFG
jgi:hypothetical protein